MTSTGNANKTALIEAAKQLIGERGYAGTSVRDLVAASGTNLAAVNYHFGTRDQLLTQAVLESFVEWTDRLGRAARADPEAGPKCRCQPVRCAVRARISSRLRSGSRPWTAPSSAIADGRRSAPLRRARTGLPPSRRRSMFAGYPLSTAAAVSASLAL